jgi:hypothetical protein
MPPDGSVRKKKQRKRSAMSEPAPPNDSPSGQGPPGPPPRPGARKEDWIANQLRRVYDDALHEPIPQRMIDLLNALDADDEDQK